MLELQNVSKYYTSNGITNIGLRNVSLKLQKNEIVAITGDSGSGKSTLLNVITKIDGFDEGEIYYKGNETSYFSIPDMDDFRKNKIGFIFQNYNILDSYTVLENVMLPLTLQGKTTAEARESALELISKVGLSGKEKNRGSKLSGGEKQRCVIARALASDCEILACDEPTGNLDSNTGIEIIQLIKEVAKDKLVLIVTHDYSQVEGIATRKIRLSDGEIVEDLSNFPDIEDDAEELDLDYKPLPAKVGMRVALKNTLFTPRKSIFLMCIFLAVALIALFSFSSTFSEYNSLGYTYAYANTQPNRIYVYTADHSTIDIEKIKEISSNYVVNPFYEDSRNTGTLYDCVCGMSAFYNAYVSGITLKRGRMPADDAKDEALVVIPQDEDLGWVAESVSLNTDYYFRWDRWSGNDLEIPVKYKVVGVAVSMDVSAITITGCPVIEQKLHRYTLTCSVDGEEYTCIDVSKNPELAENIKAEYSIDSFDKPVIILPNRTYIKAPNISFVVQGMYSYNGEYKTLKNYIESEIAGEDGIEVWAVDCVVYYDGNNTDILPAYEVSVYSDNPTDTAKKIRSLGYLADITAVDGKTSPDSIDIIMENLIAILLIGLLSVAFLLASLISYFILARVYSSKKRDYQILRTLGVTQKDMKKIVNFEVFLVGITATILAYIIFIVATVVLPAIANAQILAGNATAFIIALASFGENSKLPFIGVLIYILLMLAIMYLLAKLFNKRLFKFSVSGGLKGGDFFD